MWAKEKKIYRSFSGFEAKFYQGKITVYHESGNPSIMETWIDENGERCWKCLEIKKVF
jgi:hypothetical protein